MNRPSFLVCLGAIAIASPHAASAQTGPKAISSGSASVEIVAQELVLNEGLPLAFGLVKSRDLAGTAGEENEVGADRDKKEAAGRPAELEHQPDGEANREHAAALGPLDPFGARCRDAV